MPITVTCLGCFSHLSIPSKKIGQYVPCPKCGRVVGPVGRSPPADVAKPDTEGDRLLFSLATAPDVPHLPTPSAGPAAVDLNCPNCGEGLRITAAMSAFACGFCGWKLTVRREGGTVWLKAVGDAIAKVQAGTDRTAAELAVRRLREDLAAVEADIKEVTHRRADDHDRLNATSFKSLGVVVVTAGIVACYATTNGVLMVAVVVGCLLVLTILLANHRIADGIEAEFNRRHGPLSAERNRLRAAIGRYLATLDDDRRG